MVYALIAADALMIVAFIFRSSTLPPQIPLMYSQPWGADQLVDFWFIFLLPIILHLFFFMNIIIYNRLFFPDHFIRKIIVIANISLTAIFTFIFLKILFFVT